MYNRYIERETHGFDAVPLSFQPSGPPHDGTQESERRNGESQARHRRADGEKEGVLGILRALLDGIHMPRIESDDILLLTVAYLLLKESGDEDLLLIIAALYLFGK